MHSLHLLLAMAIGVCLFVPPLVQAVCMDLDDDDIDELMFYHNAIRANVHPRAANMRQMVWSDELAEIAAVNACQCNFQYTGLPPIPYRQRYARENHIYYPTNHLGSMVTYWYLEHANYNYHTRECYGDSTCEHYLNMVWARACEVGCALSVCHPEEIYDDLDEGDPDPKPGGANGQGSQIIDRLFMLVCVYGAGFPGDADIGNYYPYWAGEPCSECPRDRFPLCFNETSTALSSPPEPMDLMTFGAGEEPVYAPWQLPFLCCKVPESGLGLLYNRIDFDSRYFTEDWWIVYDKLGDGCCIDYPIRMRPALKYGPKYYSKNSNNVVVEKSRDFTEVLYIMLNKKRC